MPSSLFVLALTIASIFLLASFIATAPSPVLAQTTTPAPATTGSGHCYFQFHFNAHDDAEMQDLEKKVFRDRETLRRDLLTDAYPDLTASMLIQLCYVTFNVTREMNYTGPLNTKPREGCKNMVTTFNTTTYRELYKVGPQEMWETEKFVPSRVPPWMRSTSDQPVTLYIALGATSAVLIVVQVIYGVYHSYVHRGTLESVGAE